MFLIAINQLSKLSHPQMETCGEERVSRDGWVATIKTIQKTGDNYYDYGN